MSTSSSSSAEEAGGGGGGRGPLSTSRSRMRSGDEVWPEPFIEALAVRVAVDAARTLGRLYAARALYNLFQVCTTWHASSRSDLLWRHLTQRVWNSGVLLGNSWRDEYIRRHRTANNFRLSQAVYTPIYFYPTGDNNNDENNDAIACRRLALSDHRMAAGFANGAVHLYRLPGGTHLSAFHPPRRDRLGRFSSAVAGIVLTDVRIVFATVGGDVYVADLGDGGPTPLRRAHVGDVVNDGVLVDFTGCGRWWVGLYAGVPSHAFRVWNSITEELIFVGGTLTDPDAVTGWHMLTEPTELIGRVRVMNHGMAMACTAVRAIVFDLRNQIGMVLGEEEFRREIIVGSFDAIHESGLVLDTRGSATVRRVPGLERACGFIVRGGRLGLGEVLGGVNGCGYGVLLVNGVVKVWEIENGGYLYRFRETIGDCSALVTSDRYVAAYSTDGTIHLWDFGALVGQN